MGYEKFQGLVRGLPADPVLRVCLYLGYKDLFKLGGLNASFYLLVTGRVPRCVRVGDTGVRVTSGPPRFTEPNKRRLLELHNNLWRGLCNREELRPPACAADLRHFYETRCPAFYLLELAAPGTRQEFFLCTTITHVRETLIREFSEDEGRMLIQHLCRLGLDICLYAAYKDQLISVTPLYEALSIHLGSHSVLTLNYLGGIDPEERSDVEGEDSSTEPCSSTPSPKVLLSDGGTWRSARECPQVRAHEETGTLRRLHTFFRQGRTCRYQVTHWTDDKQEGLAVSDEPVSSVCVQCPPSLFCDIVFLPVTPKVNESLCCPLHIAGAPLRRDSVDVCVPLKLISIGGRAADYSFRLIPQTFKSGAAPSTPFSNDCVMSTSVLLDDMMNQAANSDEDHQGPEKGLMCPYRTMRMQVGRNRFHPQLLTSDASDDSVSVIAPAVVLLY